jgi:hypothetical protein
MDMVIKVASFYTVVLRVAAQWISEDLASGNVIRYKRSLHSNRDVSSTSILDFFDEEVKLRLQTK